MEEIIKPDMGLLYGIARSPHWEECAKHHLQIQPKCLVCDCITGLEVHHWFPFHFVIAVGRPDLELDERNLRTLCAVHHLLVGHFEDWQSYDVDLHHFLALCHGLTGVQIKSIPEWVKARQKRPIHLGQMNAAQKRALKKKLDRLFPLAA